MGMFDWVYVSDRDDFKCSKGHDIRELQTKDLDCSMAKIEIIGDSVIYTRSLFLGLARPDLDRGNEDIEVYGFCDTCGGLGRGEFCEFFVKIRGWRVESVERLTGYPVDAN